MVLDEIFATLKARGLPVKWLAIKAGYDVKSVYKWRDKTRIPNPQIVDDLLTVLDLKMELRKKPHA